MAIVVNHCHPDDVPLKVSLKGVKFEKSTLTLVISGIPVKFGKFGNFGKGFGTLHFVVLGDAPLATNSFNSSSSSGGLYLSSVEMYSNTAPGTGSDHIYIYTIIA